MLRTAIIGISGYGTEHLRLLLRGCQEKKLSAQAAVVINPEEVPRNLALLREMGCRIYSSVEALWAEENANLDLCMIPTPISTHYDFARQAVENDCHVLLEKPACATIDDLNALADLAKKRRRWIAIGFQDIYNPQIQHIKQKLLRGDLGRVRMIKSWGNWPRARAYYERNNWAGRLKDANGWVLDSPINNAMAHFLNLMLFWAGSAPEAFARPVAVEADLYRVQRIESFDTASLRLKTREGPSILYAVSHSGTDLKEPVIRIEGERGWIEWSHCGPIRMEIDGEASSYRQPGMDVIRDGMLEAICSKITHDRGQIVTVRDATAHTLTVNAVHECSAIQDIPGEFCRVQTRKRSEFLGCEMLTGLLRQCFEKECLLKEVPCPWEPADGEPFATGQYTHFSGGYLPRNVGSSR